MKDEQMGNKGLRRAAGWLLAALALSVGLSEPVRILNEMPGAIRLSRGGSTQIELKGLDAEVVNKGRQVLSSMDERLSGKGIQLTGEQEGSAQVVLKFLGFPVKTVSVTVSAERYVVPGGQSIGVALNMAGVLVVGASDVGQSPSPARQAGLRSGDLIMAVNGAAITSAQELSDCMSRGDEAQLLVSRAGRALTLNVQPVQDDRDGAFRLGAWVRDSTAGVGTLSYYDPQEGVFGALGHAITDADTGTLLTVSDGSIYQSKVVGVLRGSENSPGELLGEFMTEPMKLGSVLVNGEYGIYGTCDEAVDNTLYPNGVQVLPSSQVKEGPAQILTTLDDGGVKAYDCEITKLFRQDGAGQRGMIVKITDDTLLEKTGGIVQGMSGSPILQEGKLAGAVTHVFLGDSTQGYGMYAEWMLNQSDALDDAA